MERIENYPPTPRGADYVAAWAQMQHNYECIAIEKGVHKKCTY